MWWNRKKDHLDKYFRLYLWGGLVGTVVITAGFWILVIYWINAALNYWMGK